MTRERKRRGRAMDNVKVLTRQQDLSVGFLQYCKDRSMISGGRSCMVVMMVSVEAQPLVITL